MNNKGQAVLSEYVMIFFVVITALMAMTAYMQRGFEARVHDARNFMINELTDSGVCDSNCLNATGNRIGYEYEPYYARTFSDVTHRDATRIGQTTGNPAVIGAIYTKTTNEATGTVTSSSQLPPCASANPVPAWCNN
jgi:uncharacterized protein (UPF0333 family)